MLQSKDTVVLNVVVSFGIALFYITLEYDMHTSLSRLFVKYKTKTHI